MTDVPNHLVDLVGSFDLHPDDAAVLSVVFECIDLCSIAVGCLWGGSRPIGMGSATSDVDLFFHCNRTVRDRDVDFCVSQMSAQSVVWGVVPQGVLPWFGRCFCVLSRKRSFAVDVGFVSDDDASGFFWEPTGAILWDTAGRITRGVRYWRENCASYPFQMRDLFSRGFMAIYKGLKSSERGEFLNAIELSGQARRAVLVLLRSNQGGTASKYYGRAERRVETVLAEAILERLHRTLPAPAQESIDRCLKLLGEWLVEIGRKMELKSASECKSHSMLTELLSRL